MDPGSALTPELSGAPTSTPNSISSLASHQVVVGPLRQSTSSGLAASVLRHLAAAKERASTRSLLPSGSH